MYTVDYDRVNGFPPSYLHLTFDKFQADDKRPVNQLRYQPAYMMIAQQPEIVSYSESGELNVSIIAKKICKSAYAIGSANRAGGAGLASGVRSVLKQHVGSIMLNENFLYDMFEKFNTYKGSLKLGVKTVSWGGLHGFLSSRSEYTVLPTDLQEVVQYLLYDIFVKLGMTMYDGPFLKLFIEDHVQFSVEGIILAHVEAKIKSILEQGLQLSKSVLMQDQEGYVAINSLTQVIVSYWAALCDATQFVDSYTLAVHDVMVRIRSYMCNYQDEKMNPGLHALNEESTHFRELLLIKDVLDMALSNVYNNKLPSASQLWDYNNAIVMEGIKHLKNYQIFKMSEMTKRLSVRRIKNLHGYLKTVMVELNRDINIEDDFSFQYERQLGGLPKGINPAVPLTVIYFGQCSGYDVILQARKKVWEGVKNLDSEFAKLLQTDMSRAHMSSPVENKDTEIFLLADVAGDLDIFFEAWLFENCPPIIGYSVNGTDLVVNQPVYELRTAHLSGNQFPLLHRLQIVHTKDPVLAFLLHEREGEAKEKMPHIRVFNFDLKKKYSVKSLPTVQLTHKRTRLIRFSPLYSWNIEVSFKRLLEEEFPSHIVSHMCLEKVEALCESFNVHRSAYDNMIPVVEDFFSIDPDKKDLLKSARSFKKLDLVLKFMQQMRDNSLCASIEQFIFNFLLTKQEIRDLYVNRDALFQDDEMIFCLKYNSVLLFLDLMTDNDMISSAVESVCNEWLQSSELALVESFKDRIRSLK